MSVFNIARNDAPADEPKPVVGDQPATSEEKPETPTTA